MVGTPPRQRLTADTGRAEPPELPTFAVRGQPRGPASCFEGSPMPPAGAPGARSRLGRAGAPRATKAYGASAPRDTHGPTCANRRKVGIPTSHPCRPYGRPRIAARCISVFPTDFFPCSAQQRGPGSRCHRAGGTRGPCAKRPRQHRPRGRLDRPCRSRTPGVEGHRAWPGPGGIYREHALEGSTPSSTTSSLLSAVTSLTTIRHSVPDSFATASIRTTVSGL